MSITAPVAKILHTPQTAAEAVSYSIRTIYTEIHAGRLKAKKTSAGWRILNDDLVEWAKALPEVEV